MGVWNETAPNVQVVPDVLAGCVGVGRGVDFPGDGFVPGALLLGCGDEVAEGVDLTTLVVGLALGLAPGL